MAFHKKFCCPLCMSDCILPAQGPGGLATNNYVLIIMRQQQQIENLIKEKK